jgi:outer membrane usher protein
VLTATPRYHSAAEVPIKISGAVAASGKLVLANGEPAALLAGEVVEKANGQVVSDFFSGRTGRFLVEGLNPGVYEIRWTSGNFAPLSFEVPVKALGILHLKEPLTVKEAP